VSGPSAPGGAGARPLVSTLDIVDHHAFARGYPFDAWARLRAEAPVCPMDIPGWEPFWALTTPEHIRAVSSRPEVFRNAPTLNVLPDGGAPQGGFRSVINMDPPEHRRYRRIVTDHLTRAWVSGWRPRMEALAHELLDRTWTDAPAAECDFTADVAEWYPFGVIADLLGIPESDHAAVLDLLNRFMLGGLPALMEYMRDLALHKRHHPTDDLGSVLSTAEVDGRLLAETELVSYYCSLASAAHGTARNALAGGVLALAERPGQLALLRNRPELVDRAVEEVLRWTTPIVAFARTAAADAEIGGQPIRRGDRLALVYASANRDEATFEDPTEFRVDREVNPHLALGIGEHYCLGARLARLELSVFLSAFAGRVTDLEVTAPVQRYQSSLLGGVEHLPVRYRLAPPPAAA
jgi:cytochrome P450